MKGGMKLEGGNASTLMLITHSRRDAHMKKLVAAAAPFLFFACANAQTQSSIKDDSVAASAAPKPAARWVCNEYDRADDRLKQRTVILAQTDSQGLVEGSPLAFSFEMYEGAGVSPATSADGKVEHEDVMVNFQSADGKVGFHLYLDEMNESALTLDGAAAGDFICREAQAVATKNVSWACNDYNRETNLLGQNTVVLTQTDGKGLASGQKLGFMLESYVGAQTFTDAGEVVGTVETEDVMVNFDAEDGSLKFGLYLDEMNESSLTVADARADYICR